VKFFTHDQMLFVKILVVSIFKQHIKEILHNCACCYFYLRTVADTRLYSSQIDHCALVSFWNQWTNHLLSTFQYNHSTKLITIPNQFYNNYFKIIIRSPFSGEFR
jgi:hypothetical protein